MKHGRLRVFLPALGCAALIGLFISTPASMMRDGEFGFVYSTPQSIGEAQSILVGAGYLNASSFRQGELDKATVSALLDFQRVHSLRRTGVVDWETMSMLPAHSHAKGTRPPRVEPVVERDSDGDGVTDARDRCPDTPQGARVDASGCPADSDGDGVYDGLDQCPGTPRGERVDSKGCPSDSDGDGVFDGQDRCPDTPRGTAVDDKGCPEKAKAAPLFEGSKKSLVLEGVNFETNSATLTPTSHATLDRVAESLNDSPDVRVEIAGHTDSMGSAAHNTQLSAARADSVKRYLVSRGVDGSRLSAKGYGENQPIADNATAAGRAKNRRVELNRID
jgi:outer membrane protein OmpA-like peptidoglycan-associated protein